MARINFINPSERTRNFHRNYLYPYHLLVKALNDRDGDIYDRYNDTAQAIQSDILGKCLHENRRVRFVGSKWSLSEVPYCKDFIVDNSSLNLALPLSDTDQHPNNQNQLENYCFVQAGKKIKSITKSLGRKNKSLKTTGASNGQSIAGAISTGVHGSSIDVGSVQDYIVGLHIITSDQKMVYIERASNPVLSDAFAQKIHAEVKRDDDLFNAALVSIGAFGVIYGVVMEVEDVFLLERHIIKTKKTDAVELGKSQDFAHSNLLPHQGERPFHYKMYVNSYGDADEAVIEVMYKRPYGPYESPVEAIRSSYFGDMPKMVGKIVSVIGKSTKLFANLLSGTVFPSADEPVQLGTLGEMFYDSTTGGSVFGMAVSVNSTDSDKVLKIIEDLIVQMKVPGLPSIRYVKGTQATIGFTRFPKTAIVEIDGVQWKGLQEFLQVFSKKLSDSDLEFGIHWGKNADWNAQLVNRMYGHRKASWQNQRDTLITPEFRKVFASKCLDDTDLC